MSAALGGLPAALLRPAPPPCAFSRIPLNTLALAPLICRYDSYCPSLASVLRAQVSGKPMAGGTQALGHLREEAAMAELLERMLGLGEGGCALKLSASAKEFEEGLPSGVVD